MKKNGFTLIEIVVVTAAVAIIMVAVIGVVVTTFKLQNQTKSNSKVVSGGNGILSELKKNILNSSKENIN
jgi:prepilin-type N-terminal cleavage/methylation domain-containing protein